MSLRLGSKGCGRWNFRRCVNRLLPSLLALARDAVAGLDLHETGGGRTSEFAVLQL